MEALKMPFAKEAAYSKLSVTEEGSTTSMDSQATPFEQIHPKRPSLFGRAWTVASVLNIVFFLASCSVLTMAYLSRRGEDDSNCARTTSVWSPALNAVRYEEVEFQNRFDEPSVYRGPPTAEREKAWLDLWDRAAISIPEDKLPLLNKSFSTQNFRRLPPSAGGGISGLPDVFHQLHCLDVVRQYTWLQSGNYGSNPNTVAGEPKALPLVALPPAFDGSTVIANRMHVDHCIETLRKTLMCHADVTPLLIVADENNPIGDRPDFNIHQKCRNWDAVREWTTENWAVGRQ